MDSKDLVLVDDDLLNLIKTSLVNKQQTLAVAESVTAGILQTAFASAMEASKYFQGGITVYNLGQKTRHLQIDPIHAESCNSVSEHVAYQMARQVCNLFSSDWGIGITGYATVAPPVMNNCPFAHFSIVYNHKEIKRGFLQHQEDEPCLIQYFYVSEIIKSLSSILSTKMYKRQE